MNDPLFPETPERHDADKGAVSPGRQSISDRYERKRHLFSTRTAECFEAEDKFSGAPVHLWLLRFPLSAQSEEGQRFVKRLRRISTLKLSAPRFLQCGVDSAGSAYLAAEPIAGVPLINASAGTEELQERFLQVLRIVAKLHENGMFLGDLSEDSFLLSADGRVLLLGVLGSFDAGARQTAMLPPADTYHYLAPEQRSGSSPDITSDIYALGVYGYRMFTGRYLLADKVVSGSVDNPLLTAPAPSALQPELPRWIDDILSRCLELGAEQRYRDAGELLEAMEEAGRSGFAAGAPSAWSRRTTVVRPAVREAVAAAPLDDHLPAAGVEYEVVKTAAEHRARRSGRLLYLLIWAAAVAVGAGAAALIFYSGDIFRPASITGGENEVGQTSSAGPQDPMQQQTEYAPQELKPLLAVLASPRTGLDERQTALLKIAESDDPIAYAALMATAKSQSEPALRELAQRLLIERIKSLELKRSSAVVERWFRQEKQEQRDPGASPAYGLILAACNPGRTFESRKNAIFRAYSTDRTLALQIAAALSLDESEEKFVPALRKLLAGELGDQDIATRGVGALLFSHPALTVLLDRDAGEIIAKFSDNDLRWVLTHSPNLASPLRDNLIKEAINRKMVTPYQSIFLEAVVGSRGISTPQVVEHGLVRAALGDIQESQVDLFARWMSPFSDRVLLAVCVAAKDPEVAQDAFDILAGRSLRMQPADTLIRWIKEKFWDNRKKAVKAVGVLGLIDRASAEDVSYAFDLLMPYSRSGMFRVFIGSGNTVLIKEAIVRLGAITPTADLMPMLSHPEKDVRMAAVMALKDRNELIVLQAILRAYENEKDEEVRLAYQKYHWVTRERSGRVPR